MPPEEWLQRAPRLPAGDARSWPAARRRRRRPQQQPAPPAGRDGRRRCACPMVTTLHTPPTRGSSRRSGWPTRAARTLRRRQRAHRRRVAHVADARGRPQRRGRRPLAYRPGRRRTSSGSGRLVPEKAPAPGDRHRPGGRAPDPASPAPSPTRLLRRHGVARGSGARRRVRRPPRTGTSLGTLVGASAAMPGHAGWDEPYGLVAAESLACGTPVLAFARGGMPEFVGAGLRRAWSPRATSRPRRRWSPRGRGAGPRRARATTPCGTARWSGWSTPTSALYDAMPGWAGPRDRLLRPPPGRRALTPAARPSPRTSTPRCCGLSSLPRPRRGWRRAGCSSRATTTTRGCPRDDVTARGCCTGRRGTTPAWRDAHGADRSVDRRGARPRARRGRRVRRGRAPARLCGVPGGGRHARRPRPTGRTGWPTTSPTRSSRPGRRARTRSTGRRRGSRRPGSWAGSPASTAAPQSPARAAAGRRVLLLWGAVGARRGPQASPQPGRDAGVGLGWRDPGLRLSPDLWARAVRRRRGGDPRRSERGGRGRRGPPARRGRRPAASLREQEAHGAPPSSGSGSRSGSTRWPDPGEWPGLLDRARAARGAGWAGGRPAAGRRATRLLDAGGTRASANAVDGGMSARTASSPSSTGGTSTSPARTRSLAQQTRARRTVVVVAMGDPRWPTWSRRAARRADLRRRPPVPTPRPAAGRGPQRRRRGRRSRPGAELRGLPRRRLHPRARRSVRAVCRGPGWTRRRPAPRACSAGDGALPAAPRPPASYRDADLAGRAEPHPARPRPAADDGPAADDLRLFWSLSFAVDAARLGRVGGFDEAYVGYGGEDTDFGQRLARRRR